MTPRTVILKLGGSVIAPKGAKRPFLRRKLLDEIGSAITGIGSLPSSQLIIVHGGGSFCHPGAKRHDLVHGTRGDAAKERAAHEIHEICGGLNRRIAKILSRHIRMEIVATPAIASNRDGKLDRLDIPPILSSLDRGNVPILSGHVVDDETLGMSLLSGDTIVARLASELRADSVFLATDVDGIFTCDPHCDPTARHLPSISVGSTESMAVITGAASADATGGMSGKLAALADARFCPDRVVIFDGRNIAAYSHLLDRDFPFGTTIRFDR